MWGWCGFEGAVEMRIRGFVKAVAELLGDRVPSYRRHPRRLGAMGLDLSRTEIQSLEQRLVLAAPMLGAQLATYELSTVFGTFGRGGESQVIDGNLYTPGNDGRLPVLSKLNLQTGHAVTIVLEKEGLASGLFKQDGQIVFVGLSVANDGGYDVTYWDQLGRVNVILDADSSNAVAVSSTGRMVLSIGDDRAGYADVGEDILHDLPGVSGFKLKASSITSGNRYIGAGGFNSARDKIGLVYELNSASGQYEILKTDYKSYRGEDVTQMFLYETSDRVVGLAYFFNSETFVDGTAVLGLDGEVLAEIEGTTNSGVAVGDKFFAMTLGSESRLVAFNSTWEHEEYTAAEIFGASGYEFQRGSLAATEDGKLVVIGTRVSDGKVFVKTFEVPQDATLPQVDGSSIVVPEIVAGGAGTISWAPVAGATEYDLAFSQNGVVARTASVTTASYAVPASFRAGSYTLTIRATAGERLGPLSSEVAVVVKPQAVVRTTLTGLPVLAKSASVIRWQAVPDASSYSVTVRQVSAPANSAPVFSGTTQTNSISLPTGLAANVYELTIVARSGVILSPETKTTFTVKQGSVNVASIAVFGAHPGAQTVTWQAVAGAAVAGVTRYEVQVTELGSSTPLVTRVVTTNAVSFTLAKTGSYRLSLRVLGSPAATHGSWVTKNFVLVLPVVPGASIQLSQTIAGVATNVAFGRVAGAMKYDLWVYSFQTQQYVLKTSLTAISHRLAAGLSAGRYRLFVRGVDATDRAAAWSQKDVSIVPLAQVSGVAVSGMAIANVSGSVAWRAVSGATSYEVLITGAGNREVRRVSVSGVSLALPTGLAAGEFQLLVRAKNALSTGAWSAARVLVVRLSPVQNLRVAAITVGEAGRVLWSRVAGAVDYEVTVRRAVAAGSGAAGLGAVVHRGSSTGAEYVLPKSLPVGEFVVLVRARGVAAGLASDAVQVAWSVRPLAQVAGVTVSGFGVAGVAGQVMWSRVAGATGYEVVVTRRAGGGEVLPGRQDVQIVRRVTVSGLSYTVPSGLAAGQYRIEVRAKNDVATGAWSVARALVVRLSPVQNLRVAAITVGEAGRVLWSRVAGAVDYEVTVRRAGSAAVVHRGSATGAEYVLPKSLPVGEFLVLVKARGGAAGLASDVRQVAWSVRRLPAVVESFTSEVAAVANGGAVTVTVRDSKLKVLGTFSSLTDLGVFLKDLPAGTYPNVVRTGSVSQVVRFEKLHASPLVSVVGGRLTVAAPVGSGLNSVVQTALLLVPNVNNGPLPPVLVQGRAVGYGLPSSFSAGRVYVRLMFADGSGSDWAIVTV